MPASKVCSGIKGVFIPVPQPFPECGTIARQAFGVACPVVEFLGVHAAETPAEDVGAIARFANVLNESLQGIT